MSDYKNFVWKNRLACGVASLVLAMSACSDFDDYNTVPTDSLLTADQTLWQNIKSNTQLQQFAELLEKTGFSKELDGSKVFTVWAPLDGTYNADSLGRLDSISLADYFVKNHIACYSHALKSGETKRVYTLNGKSFDFSETAYGEQKIEQMGFPSQNGMLHTIKGRQLFYPNLYEYITTTTGIDSVTSYYKRFEYQRLDESASILGPVVGGRQTYIDSVIVKGNRLFSRLHANINEEDSSYTALLPTNDAWQKAYARIRPYFIYGAKTVSEDLSVIGLKPKKTRNIDAQQFGDSLTRNAIMNNIFFNNNHYRNRWMLDREYPFSRDTLYSTGYALFPNGPEMLAQTVSIEKMSNGYARKVDSLAFASSSWAPEILVSGVNRSTRPYVSDNAIAASVRVDEENLDTLKGNITTYIDLIPTGARALPDVYFYLPGVLSTTYEIYAVIVPPTIDRTYQGEVLPNKFLAALTYCDAKGNLKTETLGENFVNDTSKVDYVYLGTKQFPISYYGLGSDYHPSIELKTNLRIFNKDEMAAYDRELRIAAIILKPVLNN